MSQFSEFIASRTGLHFPRERWPDFIRGIDSAARDSGAADAKGFIQWLMSHPLTKRELEVLASHLTVGETYFFRDEKSFAALEEPVLSELIRQRREGGNEKHLRIWSAGCCTGEEPYSIMILLNRLIPDLDDWNLTLLATDINLQFLGKAASGRYSEWSFRTTPLWIRERYFTKTAEGRFDIDSRIKKRVTFSCLNLVEDIYPSLLNNTNAMDIIFCRNVLMYFTPEQARKVLHNLHHCLVEGGWLMISPIEIPQVLPPGFARINHRETVLYRKDSNRPHINGASIPGPRTEKPETSFLPPADNAKDESVEWLPAADSETRLASDIIDRNAAGALPDPLAQARVLYEQGCYEEATEKLLLTVKGSDNTEAMLLLARNLANSGRLADALVWCENAVATDKLNPASHYLLAVILQEQGQGSDAITALKRALYLDPDFVPAHFALGNLLLQQGKCRESEKHFQNALSILGKYPQEDCRQELEGMTAGRLSEIIRSAVAREAML